MGIEDENSGNGAETSAELQKREEARGKLVAGLNEVLGVPQKEIEAVIFRPDFDRRIFQGIQDLPHAWIVAAALDNTATEVIFLTKELRKSLGDDQIADIVEAESLSVEYKDEIFGEYYHMQSGTPEDFELAAARLRVSRLALNCVGLTELEIDKFLENLLLEQIADLISHDFDQLPPELKILLGKEAKEKMIDLKKKFEEEDDISPEKISKMVEQMNIKRKEQLDFGGVHPKMAEKIMEREDENFGKVVDRLLAEEAGNKVDFRLFLRKFFERYPDPRLFVKKILSGRGE
jgi:hypothetical protein